MKCALFQPIYVLIVLYLNDNLEFSKSNSLAIHIQVIVLGNEKKWILWMRACAFFGQNYARLL